jgi:hypothetical protein
MLSLLRSRNIGKRISVTKNLGGVFSSYLVKVLVYFLLVFGGKVYLVKDFFRLLLIMSFYFGLFLLLLVKSVSINESDGDVETNYTRSFVFLLFWG